MDTRKLKSDPHDKPVWVSWYGKDGVHGFIGKSDNQMAEEDKKFRKEVRFAKARS